MSLTLAQASIIVDKALEKGRELGFKPLTVAVLDAGGHLTALKREDGSSLLRPEIAGGKAWGALGMGFGGREFARRAAPPGRRQPRLYSGAECCLGRAHRAGAGRRADPRQGRAYRRRRRDQRRHFGQ
jgi:uncharacterized protein GlcG (DUF336 family)